MARGHVAIVGGGPAGATAAYHLRRQDFDVTIFDPAERIGPGAAFAPGDASYLLNVPAGRMAIDPAEPLDFATFAGVEPHVFAPRDTFGDYLATRFSQSGAKHERVHVRWRDELPAGTAVVLAIGPGACRSPLAPFGAGRWVESVWDARELARIGSDDSVTILGTGLSMMDAVVLLESRGHRGSITAISRSGRLPAAHAPSETIEYDGSDPFAWIRNAGPNWRGAMDGFRAHTTPYWQSLGWHRRAQFLRHLRPLWDRHRHRSPADSAATVEAMRAQGRFRVIRDDLRQPSQSTRELIAGSDWVLVATGPDHSLPRRAIPAVEELVRAGARYDPLGLGLMVDDDGRVEGVENVWALGSLAVGCRWETTAFPELRAQSARLARVIGHQMPSASS